MNEKFNLYVKSYSDDSYSELITKTPVDYKTATRIERGIEINIGDDYYVDIVEVL